jgi:hypothetical protein
MSHRFLAAILALFAILPAASAQPNAEPTPERIRAAAAKALPLLTKGAAGHVANRSCFSCHNQALPILAMSAARSRNIPIDEAEFERQVQAIAGFLAKNIDVFRKGKGTGGQVDTAGYALWALDRAGYGRDEATDAVVAYLMKRDKDRDHWMGTSNRPPSEASRFTTNYVALRGSYWFGRGSHRYNRERVVREWMEKTPAKDTEDHVFRLLGLNMGCSDSVDEAGKQLRSLQRDDGGWAQTPTMESDAYATGTALFALRETNQIESDGPEYRRAVAFLLRTQEDDGSWHVQSRSKPFQLYFETGFPHGKDQFISSAATAWAVQALVRALPEEPPVAPALLAKIDKLSLGFRRGHETQPWHLTVNLDNENAADWQPILASLPDSVEVEVRVSDIRVELLEKLAGAKCIRTVGVGRFPYTTAKVGIWTPEHFRALSRMPRLKDLTIYEDIRINDAHAAEIGKIKSLQRLFVDWPIDSDTISDGGAESFAQLGELRELFFAGHRMTKAGLGKFARLKNLEDLYTSYLSRIDDAGMTELAKLRSLKKVSFDGSKVTARGFAEIPKLADLEWLTIRGATLRSDEVSTLGKSLTELRRLTDLTLSTDKGEMDELLTYVRRIPQLEGLEVHSDQLTDKGLAQIAGLPLTSLNLCFSAAITDAGLKHIAECRELASLNLDGLSAVTDKGLAMLRSLQNLSDLRVSDTGVTAEGIEALRQAIPALKRIGGP